MTDLELFIHNVVLHGLEYFRIYVGVYRGIVVDNKDPDKRGRVKAYVPYVGQTEATTPEVWIDPSFPAAGADHGMFWPPEQGDAVRVMFEEGNARRPAVYFGGWFGNPNNTSEVPSEMAPDSQGRPYKRGLLTRRGHSIVFDDTPGGETITITWNQPTPVGQDDETKTPSRPGNQASLKFTSDGDVQLLDKNQNKVLLKADTGIQIEDKNGNKFHMDSGNVEIDAGSHTVNIHTTGQLTVEGATINVGNGASSPIPLGDLLVQLYNTHVHGSAAGPTGPPVVPLTPAVLSSTVKVKP